DLAVRRSMIIAGEDMIAAAYATDDGRSAGELIEEAEDRIHAVAPKAANEKTELSLADAIRSAIDAANDAHQRGSGLAGISTGLRALDEKIGGLAPGNFVVLAGRPSMGKTALALNIADNIARTGVPVGFYSLEMTASE